MRQVDLTDCQDDEVARKAIKAGFDVVECPDFWEQPETVTFDAKKVKPLEMYPVDERSGGFSDEFGDDKETFDKAVRHPQNSKDPKINALIEEMRLKQRGASAWSTSTRAVGRAAVREAVKAVPGLPSFIVQAPLPGWRSADVGLDKSMTRTRGWRARVRKSQLYRQRIVPSSRPLGGAIRY